MQSGSPMSLGYANRQEPSCHSAILDQYRILADSSDSMEYPLFAFTVSGSLEKPVNGAV